MPPRLSKRQQREQEEIAALASASSPVEPKNVVHEESESDDASHPISKPPVKPAAGGFSLLGTADVEEPSEEEEDNKGTTSAKKKTKKKKKKTSTAHDTPAASTPSKSADVSSKAAATSGKKAKGKAKKEDDLDRALAELSLKYSDITVPDPSTTQVAAPALTSALQTMRSLLAIQPKHLDPDAEMRRFFGSKVISAAESSSSSTPGGQQPRAPLARSVLCRPQSSWPPAAMRDGLTMRPLTVDETKMKDGGEKAEKNWMRMPGDKWFTVEHSPEYRWDQLQFIQVVGMLDPNNLFTLMRESFWHADTLLQIGEVYRAQDDYSVSSDFTSRALFAYERSFSGAFNLTNGGSRIDFRKVENRSLFLALHRTVLYLERRGTMRTAFEFARLLWALDPWTDPEGALMHLDFLAVKAEQHEWFLETEEVWEEIRKERPTLPSFNARPGWRWSKALILKGLGVKKGGGEKKATEELKQAISQFPEVLAVLAPLVGLNLPSKFNLPTPFSRWDSSNEQRSALWLMSLVYANRSISLWKIPETLTWLTTTVQSLDGVQPSKSLALFSNLGDADSFVQSVIRHAIVSDMKPLAPFIGSLHALHGPQQGFDIVPPLGDGVTMYDEAYFSSANPETAKKRRDGRAAGQRRGRGRGGEQRIEVDPTEFLQMLEDILAVDMEHQRRDDVLRALQDGPGANVVVQLEVRA
ncbi:hypothetical protein M408DRAFT_186122 [Serendipita vermifera MAFF 305830]|uniref:DUF654-domain-containing protein n=1 Tax=Serendipita vermifera MAFF 305830 TaxID=933852 RepID=A0A0C3BMU3_SERVB|nr:hypothetical protein M408DRAFT_186122 [Serendipita vermifera MAFF 305830]